MKALSKRDTADRATRNASRASAGFKLSRIPKFLAATALMVFFLLGTGGGRAATQHPDLNLTPDEIRWIKEHPVVTLGAAASFDPFVNRNEDGQLSGFDVDITDYISKKTGLKFRFVIGDWKKILKRAEERELDGVTCSLPSPARAKYFNFTIPYTEYSSIIIVRKDNPKAIHSVKDLDGKRAAVMTGNLNNLNDIRRLGGDVEIIFKPDLYNVIRSVVMGECDFSVGGEPAHYLATKLGMAGFLKTAFPTGITTRFSFSLRNDEPELLSIFNKALKSIPQEKMVALRNKWLSGAAWEPVTRDGRIKLSTKEQNFLSISHSLGVCVRGDQLPFSQFTSDGKLDGMVADFINLAEDNLGRGVRLLPVKTSSPLEALLDKKCDLVMMSREPAHEIPGIVFTTPFLSFPYVVVATIDKQFQMSFLPEGHQTYAVLKDSPVLPKLKEAWPEIEFRETPSVEEGLRNVRSGAFYGLIAPSPTVTYDIQKNYLTELKITGQTPFTADFAVATRNSPPFLNLIFQKIVGSLHDEAKRKIVNKWMAVKYEKGVDYSLIWKIIAGAALLLAGTVFWNRKLGIAKRRAESALAAEREAVKANLNFIDMISHEYRSPLSVISCNLDLIEEKTIDGNAENVGRELGRMRNSAQRLLNIFEKSLSKIRMNSASLLPDKKEVDIGHIARSAVRDIQNAHPDHAVELEMCDASPLLVRADPELLNVAVINILDNACKYSDSDKPIKVSFGEKKKKAVFRVQDHGIGIAENDLKHIFEKYYRSQSVGTKRGVGIGLHLVKTIVELHEGKIHVISKPGEGTTFTVELPIAQAQ